MPHASNNEKSPLKTNKNEVTIRMYRAGFGDCFLLAFPAKRNQTKYLLIDCGIHHGYDGRKALMQNIAAHIKSDTDGKIETLVVTHEHTDHISGFNLGRQFFADININNVWMGWTENYNDPKVKQLDKKKKRYLQGLLAAAEAAEKHDKDGSERIKRLLAFYDDSVLSASSSRRIKHMYNRDIMKWLQKKAKNGPTFCTPGRPPLMLDGVDDVRIFVLGPPQEDELLKQSNPSRGEGKETYLTDGPLEMYDAFVDSILALNQDGIGSFQDDRVTSPFAKGYWKRDFGAGDDIYRRLYSLESETWRKIDNEWLDIAGELAIKMDNHTNNSSLVLAIELGKNGNVLLFPGDAQVGNWLSWQDLEWDLGDRIVTADDLLKRTVVYKVGHHGSHNATLKADGLEKMNHPDLVALLPVDQNYANEKQNWSIPYEGLLDVLTEKCQHRIVRTDKTRPGSLEKPPDLSSYRWGKFKKKLTVKDTYIDYTVKWK